MTVIKLTKTTMLMPTMVMMTVVNLIELILPSPPADSAFPSSKHVAFLLTACWLGQENERCEHWKYMRDPDMSDHHLMQQVQPTWQCFFSVPIAGAESEL